MPYFNRMFSKYGSAILVVFAIIATLVCMALILFPNMREIKSEVEEYETKYNILSEKTVDENKLLADLNEAELKLKEYEDIFPPVMEQGDTLRKVQSFEVGSGFEVISMGYERLQYDTLNQPVDEKKDNSSQTTNTDLTPVPGKGMKIPIKTQFMSNYAELKEYLTLVNETKQRIGFREFQMSTDRTGAQKIIKGSMILEFYGFMPEEDIENK